MNRRAYGLYQMIFGAFVLVLGIGVLVTLGSDTRFLVLGPIMIVIATIGIFIGYRRHRS